MNSLVTRIEKLEKQGAADVEMVDFSGVGIPTSATRAQLRNILKEIDGQSADLPLIT